MDIHFFLILGHIIGTVFGVGGATFIEVHLNHALKDGKMDENDRAILGKDFFLTRLGMALGFLTGIGFIIEEYSARGSIFRLSDGVFWSKIAIFCIIIINAYLLHKHKIGLYWGSAFSFVSWWAILIFGVFLTNGVKFFPGSVTTSFFVLMAVYFAIVVIGAQILHKIRSRVTIH